VSHFDQMPIPLAAKLAQTEIRRMCWQRLLIALGITGSTALVAASVLTAIAIYG
jgi:hypothetical protein